MDEPPPPPPPERRPRAPRRRRWGPGKILLVWVGLPVAAVGSLIFLGAVFLATGKEHPVTDADRAVLVTPARLAEHAEWFTPLEDREVVKKVRYLDGSWELSCEYEHPEGDDRVYLLCTLTREPSRREAATTYTAAGAATDIAMRLEDLVTRERDDLLRWGRRSRCVLLETEDGAPVGNWFHCLDGETVFDVYLAGVYFDDAEALSGFLTPVLERLADWEPE